MHNLLPPLLWFGFFVVFLFGGVYSKQEMFKINYIRIFVEDALLYEWFNSAWLIFFTALTQVEIIRTYTAKQSDELSLQVADVVLVYQKVNDGE